MYDVYLVELADMSLAELRRLERWMRRQLTFLRQETEDK
jgi:hypothetical protein